MKVCYFGSYDKECTRNRIIIKGLKQNGVEVVECNDRHSFLRKYLSLAKKYFSLDDFDAVIVGEFGQTDVPTAWILTKITKKPLIFDVFVSTYDGIIHDRKLFKENSFRAKYYYYLDKISCKLPKILFLDTNEHIKYFNEEFGISEKKFRRIFVGSDDEIFYPRKNVKNNDTFTITFYGSFIPLHGLQYIVRAAKLLEEYKDIKFEILGSGQTYNFIRDLSEKLKICNIVFIKERVKYEEIPNFITKSDVCLGIFGDTAKAKRVIPNKVYEALAMGKPLITGDSPAIKECGIVNRKNTLLVEMANPEAIANAILELKDDEKLRNDIAKNGLALFKENFTPKIIGKGVKKVLEEVL